MKVLIVSSNRKFKKWFALLPTGVQVHFGDNRYEDFTQHGDVNRKENYLKRHGGIAPSYTGSHSEDWKDPMAAGFWSRWLLWNMPSLEKSAADIERRFGIKVQLRLQS